MDVEVDEDEAAGCWVWAERTRPHTAARAGRGGVAGSGGDGAAGDDDQRGAVGAVVGEPVLDGGEHVVEDGVGDVRVVRRLRLPGEQQDGAGRSPGGGVVFGQLGEGAEGGQWGSAAVGRVGGGTEDARPGAAGRRRAG